MPTPSTPTRHLIIGAGPAGLISARAFLNRGLDVEIVERHSAPGGIWDIDNPGSPMYESCSMITSAKAGGFVGYPLSEAPSAAGGTHMYPTWRQLRDYIRDFARAYRLDELITFNMSVDHVTPIDRDGHRTYQVSFTDGSSKKYLGVVAANGSQWQRRQPDIPGAETFTGRLIHSSQYRSRQEFDGKRVLVVGAGNSGVDIASDAASRADAAFLSTRRPYYFFPKTLFGAALPDFLDGRAGIPQQNWSKDVGPEDIMDLVLAAVGDITQFGLPKPEGPVGATHPIVSTAILDAFAHGRIEWRPDVERIDGDQVVFRDGRRENIDVIVLATGYDAHYDFLDDDLVDYHDGHAVLHLGTFFPGQPGLYAAGAVHAAVGANWTMFDNLVNYAAADAAARATGENAENLRRFREEYDPDLTGGFPFADVPRNANQADPATMLVTVPDEARREFDIPVPTGFDDTEFYARMATV